MLILVTDKNIDKIWNRMTIGLARAVYPDDMGSVHSLSDLYDKVLSQESIGGYQVESGYSFIMSVIKYPHKSFLFVYFGGKDPANTTEINYPELDEFLVEVAKIFNCSHIEVQGRRGWERKVKHLGYSLETVNIFKEVPK